MEHPPLRRGVREVLTPTTAGSSMGRVLWADRKPPSRAARATCTGGSRARCRWTTRAPQHRESPARSRVAASWTWAAARTVRPGARSRARPSVSTSPRRCSPDRTGPGWTAGPGHRCRDGCRSGRPGRCRDCRRDLRTPGTECGRRCLCRGARVLHPGGTFVVVDKNLYSLNATSLAAECDREVDRRARPLDVSTPRAGPGERWFRPGWHAASAEAVVPRGPHRPRPHAKRVDFRSSNPGARLLVSWAAQRPEGSHDTVRADSGIAAALVVAGTPDSISSWPRKVPFEAVKDAHPLPHSEAVDSSCSMDASRQGNRSPSTRSIAIDVDALRGRAMRSCCIALVDPRSARASWAVGLYRLNERGRAIPRRGSADAWSPARARSSPRRVAYDPSGFLPVSLSFRLQFPGPTWTSPFLRDYHRSRRRPETPGRLLHCIFVSTPRLRLVIPRSSSDLRDHDDPVASRHFHHVYREPEANRLNLERAQRVSAELRLRSPRLRLALLADGARTPTTPWRISATSTRPTSSYWLRRPPLLSLEGGPVLADLADPGPPGLRGTVPRVGRRRSASHRRIPSRSGRRLAARRGRASDRLWSFGMPAEPDARGHLRIPAPRWSPPGRWPWRAWTFSTQRGGGDGEGAEQRWAGHPS